MRVTWEVYIPTSCVHIHNQGVVTAMCPVLPPATTIKVKSKDQAYRRAPIKGSRYRLGNKYDQIKLNTVTPAFFLCFVLYDAAHTR